MKERITYRTYQDIDKTELERIISETWCYEKFCSPKISKKLARIYLASCLCQNSYTCVAEYDGKAVGIIVGKSLRNPKLNRKFALRQMFSYISLIITKEGKDVMKMFEHFENIDKELLLNSKISFDGELSFFAVHQDMKGQGIGKALYNNLMNYFANQNIKSFYLYTDSSCNFKFYEYQGMTRLCEKDYCFKPYAEENMTFFLYGKIQS